METGKSTSLESLCAAFRMKNGFIEKASDHPIFSKLGAGWVGKSSSRVRTRRHFQQLLSYLLAPERAGIRCGILLRDDAVEGGSLTDQRSCVTLICGQIKAPLLDEKNRGDAVHSTYFVHIDFYLGISVTKRRVGCCCMLMLKCK